MPVYQLRRARAPDQTKGGVWVVETKRELAKLTDKLKELADKGEPVGYDVETYGVNPKEESPVNKGKVATIQLSWFSSTLGKGVRGTELGCRVLVSNLAVAPFEYQAFDYPAFCDWVNSPVEQKIGHNIFSFDRHVTSNHTPIRGIKLDTLRLAWQYASDKNAPHGLKELMEKFLGYVEVGSWEKLFSVPLISEKTGKPLKRTRVLGADEILKCYETDRALWNTFIDYASLDPKACLELYRVLLANLDELPSTLLGAQSDLANKFWQPFCLLISYLESNGVLVDSEYCTKEGGKLDVEASGYEQDLNSWLQRRFPSWPTEEEVTKGKRNPKIVLESNLPNWRSAPQLCRILYGKTSESEEDTESSSTDGFARPNKTGPRLPTLGLPPSPVWKKGSTWNWKTKQYDLKTDADAIQYLADHAPDEDMKEGLKLLLKYRRTARNAMYFEKMPKFINEVSGRVHAMIKPDAETTRLNVANPPLLQSPELIRNAFPAEEGKVVVIFDYSQLEQRVKSHYFIEWFDDWTLEESLAKSDIHSYNAYEIFAKLYPSQFKGYSNTDNLKSTPLALFRQQAKTTAYALDYGVGYKKLGVMLRDEQGEPSTEKYAAQVVEDYCSLYPGQNKLFERIWELVTTQGYITDLMGYVRPLPHGKCKVPWKEKDKAKWTVHRAWRQGLNTPMQMGAAKIVAEAMLRCNTYPDPYLKSRGWFNYELAFLGYSMRLQMHDEIVGYSPEETAEEVCKIQREIMENPTMCKIHSKLAVSGGHGKTWGAGH